jgi:formylmethanofuran dehydrogenase subunit E
VNVPDNYDQWLAHEAKLEQLLDRLPECEECGALIQEDFYYEINDSIICEYCLNKNYRKRTEDFVR